jgi:glycosyltransferase involved in cell wall biosynthesis
MKKLLFIGPIAPPQWGPAVRNRIMVDTFREWKINIESINTLEWKSKPFSFLVKIVVKSLCRQQIIISVSKNGRFLLLPIVSFIGLFRNSKIVLIPAGGTFAIEINKLPYLLKQIYLAILRRCDVVFVQRKELESQFNTMNVSNISIMPNFKVAPQGLPPKISTKKLKLLFLSRIRPLKGIEVLFEALDLLFKDGADFTVDFFGIISPDYFDTFSSFLRQRSYARYCGVLEYSKVISEISSYDFMVFPTQCDTEGFPGVLADCALAGLPVVASDLSSTREIIVDGFNGLLAKVDDSFDFYEKIKKIYFDDALRSRLGTNNVSEGKKYEVNYVLNQFCSILRKKGWKF